MNQLNQKESCIQLGNPHFTARLLKPALANVLVPPSLVQTSKLARTLWPLPRAKLGKISLFYSIVVTPTFNQVMLQISSSVNFAFLVELSADGNLYILVQKKLGLLKNFQGFFHYMLSIFRTFGSIFQISGFFGLAFI